jgi:hypothetical protein
MILASRILFHTHEQQIKRSPTPPLTVQSRSRMKIRQGNFVLVFYSNLKSCEMRLDPNHGTIINLKYIASFFSLLRAIEKVNQKPKSG